MIVVEQDRCSRCGSCVRICHESCMAFAEGDLRIDHGLCSTCTQCIAVCPELALSWDGAPPVPFDDGLLPTATQLGELLRQRRTVRHFRDRAVDRDLVEEIVSCAAFAPTHDFGLRAVAVDDPAIIALADSAVYRGGRRIYNLLFRPRPVYGLLKRLSGVWREELARAKPKLESSLRLGRAYESRPAVIVFVVGDRRTPLSLESAQYALYNMSLYAQTRGIGSRILVGNQMFMDRSRPLRSALALGRHERICGTLGLGHPSVRFGNKVTGRAFPIRWNGE